MIQNVLNIEHYISASHDIRVIIPQETQDILENLVKYILSLENTLGKSCDHLDEFNSVLRLIISHAQVAEGMASLYVLKIFWSVHYDARTFFWE